MAKSRSLIHSTLSNTASRKAFRYVSKDELKRIGLNTNTKLLVPKTQKRVTKNTKAIPQSVLKAVSRTRGAKREKTLEKAASKIVSLDNAASKQTVQRQKRRDAAITKTEKQSTARKVGAFPEEFLIRVKADAANRTRVAKADGKNKGAVAFIVRNDTALTALDNRAKRLQGKHIPDGEYQAMMDYMAHYNDPYYQLMRGSPDVKGARITI